MIKTEEDLKVKSLGKAMRVLEAFSIKTPELGVSEIAKMLGYQKTTVFNILSTYQALGYVGQNTETGKYYLSLKLLHFGYIINNHLSINKVLKEPISRISSLLGEVCFLGVPHDHCVLYMDAAFPQNSTFRSMPGETAPMYCTGLGKAMMAFLPENELEQVLALSRTSYTASTIVAREALIEELKIIKRRGYAVDNMEHEYGVCCVAVPVFNSNQQLVAAVSVSGPSLRFDQDTIVKIYHTLTEILTPFHAQL